MYPSFQKIAAFMDPVVTPARLSRLQTMHQHSSSFRDIWNRHNQSHRRQLRFMFLNTFLLDFGGQGNKGGKLLKIFAPGIGHLINEKWLENASKPAIEARAKEIGRLISGRYDIAALTEVFKNREREHILNQWPKDQKPFFASATAKTIFGSAGLLTISKRYQIAERVFHEFHFETGTDKRADKGVLLTRIDLGLGASKLEIFNTHLNAGNDQTQRFQLIEMADFISRHHQPQNPALLVGDLNMGALNTNAVAPADLFPSPEKANSKVRELIFTSPFYRLLRAQDHALTEYDLLTLVLGRIGFLDAWKERNDTVGYTSSMGDKEVAALIAKPAADDAFYCDDFDVPHPSSFRDEKGKLRSNRLDYIFFNKPNSRQSFHLDFTRPRRLRLDRPGQSFEWLSDHIGLEVTLIASGRV